MTGLSEKDRGAEVEALLERATCDHQHGAAGPGVSLTKFAMLRAYAAGVEAARSSPQEGAGEPVAWLRDVGGYAGDDLWEECLVPAAKGDPGAFPVFTSPPADPRIKALEEALRPFAEAAHKAQISGCPPFQFVGAPEYAAALAALNQGADHG